MAYASVTDVEARLGRSFDTTEAQLVSTRLADAELILKSRIPDLDQKVLDAAISQDAVVMVECDMVLRLVRNPDGYTAEADGTYSYQISADVASGKLTVLGHEWALLGIRGGVYTIAPYLAMPTLPDPWAGW